MYFKITNAEENHHKFQFVDGLNVLIEKFNDDPEVSCGAGGFYFTDVANILKFLDFGVYLREVTLPTDNPDFKMIKDKNNNKWRANMIILGNRYDLLNEETYEYLISCGANNHFDNDIALRLNARKGRLNIVKYLIKKGADIHAENDYAFRWSASCGHLDVVKYFVENGANVCAEDDYALRWSAACGHLDVVKYLVEHGANVCAENDYALRWSAICGHLDIVKYLVEHGANVSADNDYALKWSKFYGHSDIVEYLIENGANIMFANI